MKDNQITIKYFEQVAEGAYKMADAMIKERAK